MAKEYVILHTDAAVIVPIKAVFYPGTTDHAYQATFPQFFGGTVSPGHTLSDEVSEESQGQLTLSGLKLLAYSTIIHEKGKDEEYKFYSRNLTTLPVLHPLRTTGVPNNELEMQDLLVLPKTAFGQTFEVNQLLKLCNDINSNYCDPSKCQNPDGSCQWDDDGTKNAFERFLAVWGGQS